MAQDASPLPPPDTDPGMQPPPQAAVRREGEPLVAHHVGAGTQDGVPRPPTTAVQALSTPTRPASSTPTIAHAQPPTLALRPIGFTASWGSSQVDLVAHPTPDLSAKLDAAQRNRAATLLSQPWHEIGMRWGTENVLFVSCKIDVPQAQASGPAPPQVPLLLSVVPTSSPDAVLTSVRFGNGADALVLPVRESRTLDALSMTLLVPYADYTPDQEAALEACAQGQCLVRAENDQATVYYKFWNGPAALFRAHLSVLRNDLFDAWVVTDIRVRPAMFATQALLAQPTALQNFFTSVGLWSQFLPQQENGGTDWTQVIDDVIETCHGQEGTPSEGHARFVGVRIPVTWPLQRSTFADKVWNIDLTLQGSGVTGIGLSAIRTPPPAAAPHAALRLRDGWDGETYFKRHVFEYHAALRQEFPCVSRTRNIDWPGAAAKVVQACAGRPGVPVGSWDPPVREYAGVRLGSTTTNVQLRFSDVANGVVMDLRVYDPVLFTEPPKFRWQER